MPALESAGLGSNQLTSTHSVFNMFDRGLNLLDLQTSFSQYMRQDARSQKWPGALKSLDSLDKKDIQVGHLRHLLPVVPKPFGQEIKSFAKPPPLVMMTMEAAEPQNGGNTLGLDGWFQAFHS